jgi:hypothetical protein
MGNPFQAALLNGGVFPPSNQPQVPQPGTQSDPLMQSTQQSMQMGQGAFQQDAQRRTELAKTLADLQQQQGQLQPPKMGPGIDKGAGALHNIGQVLLMMANMTGPGQALNQAIYGPGKQQYAAKSGALAQRIGEIQTEAGPESQAMGAAANLATRPMTGYGSILRGEAAQTTAGANVMNAQTRQTAEQHKTVLQTEANRIREQIGQGKLTQEQARTQMMGVIQRERDATLRDVASMTTDRATQVEQMRAAEEDYKTESDHVLQSLLGMSPSKPVQPAAGGKPAAIKSPAKGGGMPAGATHIGISSVDQKPYYLDAQGNKLGPAPASR